MFRYSCVMLFLATSWVDAHAQGNAECSREPPYVHRPCPPDTVRREAPDAGQARLERERAILQQRERELQQQLQRDRLIQQRMQMEQARQRQERRDRQNSDWQQLGDTFRGEMERIQAQQERQNDADYSPTLRDSAALSGCRETITVNGQTINLGDDIRRAGGPGPALQQLRHSERDFRAKNGDCSRFTQVRESYQACRIQKEMLDAAIRATQACATAETNRRMQAATAGTAGAAGTANPAPQTGRLSSTEAANNYLEPSVEAGALRDSINSMNPSDALASAAAALDSLKPPPTAKDPSQNYAGESCSYFTRPLVREDGAGLNRYAEGSMVCYGERMYQCVDGRWADRHRCDNYADWQGRRAETFESSGSSVQIHQPDGAAANSASSSSRGANPPSGDSPVASSPPVAVAPPRTGSSAPSASRTDISGRSPPAAQTGAAVQDPVVAAPPRPSLPSRGSLKPCVQMTTSDHPQPYGHRYSANFINHCNEGFEVLVLEANGHTGRLRIEPRARTSYSCEDRIGLGHRNCGGIRSWDYAQ